MHLINGKLAQKQLKRRYDNVTICFHSILCKKHGLESSDSWYEHTPVEVVETDEVELCWDRIIQIGMAVAHNRPYIILVEKAIRKWTIIDIAFPCRDIHSICCD